MSEQETSGTEVAASAKAKRPAPEVTTVQMQDGRTVNFVGKRKMLKEYDIGDDSVTLTFDFVNGETRKVGIGRDDPLLLQYAAHGAVQKIGDETAGEENVEDMVLAVDSIIGRLAEGKWGTVRAAGDGFAGASVVVRAIVEASEGRKTVADVKTWLENKLAAGKDSGLTRQKLYAAFRAPGTKTAAIIERIEREKASKDVAIDADAALSELTA